MESNISSTSERTRILWREPFTFQWKRMPTFPPLWRLATRRRLTFLGIIYVIGFTCALCVKILGPTWISHPFWDAFLIISIGWIGPFWGFSILIIWYFMQFAVPATVRIIRGNLFLDKPLNEIPFSEITEARVTGDRNEVRSLTVSTAKISRTVWIPVGADLSELQKMLRVRLVFDNSSPRKSNKK